MRRDPPTTTADTSLKQALAQMLETETGCLLVVSGRQLLGIVTERDLLAATAKLLP